MPLNNLTNDTGVSASIEIQNEEHVMFACDFGYNLQVKFLLHRLLFLCYYSMFMRIRFSYIFRFNFILGNYFSGVWLSH